MKQFPWIVVVFLSLPLFADPQMLLQGEPWLQWSNVSCSTLDGALFIQLSDAKKLSKSTLIIAFEENGQMNLAFTDPYHLTWSAVDSDPSHRCTIHVQRDNVTMVSFKCTGLTTNGMQADLEIPQTHPIVCKK